MQHKYCIAKSGPWNAPAQGSRTARPKLTAIAERFSPRPEARAILPVQVRGLSRPNCGKIPLDGADGTLCRTAIIQLRSSVQKTLGPPLPVSMAALLAASPSSFAWAVSWSICARMNSE
jgi:hypothetical protein